MAFLQLSFASQYLAGENRVSVILPDIPDGAEPAEFFEKNRAFRVLWLLHGTGGNETDWVRKTNIELYAAEKGIAVVMPNALNSGYVNWKHFGLGFHMYDYFFKELMPLVYNWLPVSKKREDNFIAGLSMGGRGCTIYALSHPEKFAAAGVLSSVPRDPADKSPRMIDINTVIPAHLRDFRPTTRQEYEIENVGGEEGFKNSLSNTWDRLDEAEKYGTDLPKFYFAMGTKDDSYGEYKLFKKHCREKGYEGFVFEEDDYAHEWRFWDKYIERFLDLYVPAGGGK